MAGRYTKQARQLNVNQLKAMDKDELIELFSGTLSESNQMCDQIKALTELNDRMKKFDDFNPRELKEQNEDLKEQMKDMSTKLNTLDLLKNGMEALSKKVEAVEAAIGDHNTQLARVADLPHRMNEVEDTLENSNKDIYKALEYLQRFAEGLDSDQRGENLVMLGLSETSDSIGDDDLARARSVIEKTGAMSTEEIGDIEVKRLGNGNGSGRARPLLVTLDDRQKQWKIIQKAKNLNEINGYSNIYIKKDIHPTIRMELNRLRRKVKELRDDASNSGVDIKYDYKIKLLTRGGIVIDRFNPHFQ